MRLHPLIAAHRELWRSKPGLRAVYGDYHRLMAFRQLAVLERRPGPLR